MPAKKTGGLSRTTYIMIAAGSVGAYLIYRWYENRAAAAAQTATTGGTSVPAPTAGTPATVGPASLDQWIQAAISSGQYSASYTNSNLYNDIQSWLNGNCVSATGYTTIGNLISTLGLPPGYTPPTLSACPSSTAATAPQTPSRTASGGDLNTAGNALYTGSGLSFIPTTQLAQALEAQGFKIVGNVDPNSPQALYYNPQQFGGSPGAIGINSPQTAGALNKAGFKLITVGNEQYYIP